MRPGPRLAILAVAILLAALLGAAAAAGGAPRKHRSRHHHRSAPTAPASLFGIAPQGQMSERDAEYMAAGGISTVRMFVPWASIKPSRNAPYDWSGLDDGVTIAARAGLRVLPFLWGTPHWVAARPTTMPVGNGAARRAWSEFLTAAVERYGPHGLFWREHAALGPGPDYDPPVPKLPIRIWQIWNEANFYYFAKPVSPSAYARLVTISSKAIKAADPGAKVVLSGLFAKPTKGGSDGMPADRFLKAVYRAPGIKSRFDGVALHPYAISTRSLEEFVEAFHEVTVENHDRVPLYITEMGWGSQNDFNQVAFEQGIRGQARELRGAYRYLLGNRRRLDLKQVYWFSWKDNRQIPNCNFCDSVGLFREGRGFRPKPAWREFVSFTGGVARP
jgi:hypothetical protein